MLRLFFGSFVSQIVIIEEGVYCWWEAKKQDKGTENANEVPRDGWGHRPHRGGRECCQHGILGALMSGPETGAGPVVLARLNTVLMPGQQVLRLSSLCPISPSPPKPNLRLDRSSPQHYLLFSKLPTTCTNFLMCLVFFCKQTPLKGLKFVHEALTPSALWVTLWETLVYPFTAWNIPPLLKLLCLQAVTSLK